jgi:DNA-binding GntR family transcriptional regulator
MKQPPPISRIENITLQERSYQELASALMKGRFLPGQIVTIRGLAKQLGTSAMPVREAMGRLVVDQALEMLPNRSFRLPVFTLERFTQLWATRKHLEGWAVELSAKSITNERIEELAELEEEIRLKGTHKNVEQYLDLNQKFHFKIYDATGNIYLVRFIESIWRLAGPFILARIRQDIQDKADIRTHGIGNNRPLIQALAKHAAAKARHLLIEDLEKTEDYNLKHWPFGEGIAV